ncbi:YveK family protein [Bacillus kwashiorkori]|uniref:YveK family protein n=1 Tax=Bacillus kwashiorkori TaxID=1522318 RepID=UPI000782237F|nr:Wzz/FepE/Etk N-terminal domain-containing protein [Bacillus kwashiorkori]
MEETISLKEIFAILRKRLSLIVIIAFLTTTIAAVVSYFVITPVYQVSTQILVNRSQTDEAINYSDVQTNLQLINTYNVIITSPRILDIVIDDLNLDMTTSQLKNKLTVQSEKNSQVVNISVQDPEPQKAVLIANKIADVFQREVVSLMKVDNVSILAKASASDNISPVKPKPTLNMAIALVVGLMVGVGLAFLLEYLDNTIKTEQDIEKILNLPVLGVINQFELEGPNFSSSRAANRGGR